MKCSDLIDELKGYNPNADVVLVFSEDIELSWIDGDGEFTKETTPIVFIEGCDLGESVAP